MRKKRSEIVLTNRFVNATIDKPKIAFEQVDARKCLVIHTAHKLWSITGQNLHLECAFLPFNSIVWLEPPTKETNTIELKQVLISRGCVVKVLPPPIEDAVIAEQLIEAPTKRLETFREVVMGLANEVEPNVPGVIEACEHALSKVGL